MADGTTLYLICFRDAAKPLDEASISGLRRLDEGLYLLRSALTRSRVYHHIKRHVQPGSLLVAPLSGDPKFMGMEPGALKWLRSGV